MDVNILNTNNIDFNYSKENNIFFLQLSSVYYYYFFLLNKKNLSSPLFSNLDSVLISYTDNNNYYCVSQSMFSDFKIIVNILVGRNIQSISGVYSGNSWIEREVREFNKIFFINLNDTRKLLLNYNYNDTLYYNNYNNIVNDINV